MNREFKIKLKQKSPRQLLKKNEHAIYFLQEGPATLHLLFQCVFDRWMDTALPSAALPLWLSRLAQHTYGGLASRLALAFMHSSYLSFWWGQFQNKTQWKRITWQRRKQRQVNYSQVTFPFCFYTNDFHRTVKKINRVLKIVSEVFHSISSALFSVFVVRQQTLNVRWPFPLTTTTESSFWAPGSAQTHSLKIDWNLASTGSLTVSKQHHSKYDPRLGRNPMKDNPSVKVVNKEHLWVRAWWRWQTPSWKTSWLHLYMQYIFVIYFILSLIIPLRLHACIVISPQSKSDNVFFSETCSKRKQHPFLK